MSKSQKKTTKAAIVTKETFQYKSPYQRDIVENEKGLEIYTIENFVKEEECDYLSVLIQKNHTRSLVASSDAYGSSVTDEGRTSSTSTLDLTDPIVSIINKRIHDEVGIPMEYGESIQGQLYEVGQEFRHHTDYFDENSYPNHCLHSGQRTWTLMVYLNDVEEGGFTDFPHIGKMVIPKKGRAVLWKNSDGTGKENAAALHAGLPVIKGKKIIITKWFRENPWDMLKDAKLSEEYWKKNPKKDIKKTVIENKISTKKDNDLSNHLKFKIEDTFEIKSPADLPRLSKLGFTVVKVPKKTWKLVQEAYHLLSTSTINNVIRKENWDGITNFIHDGSKNQANIDFFDMDIIPRLKEIIQEELQPAHEAFIEFKEELEPVWIYGIRSYTKGAMLEVHTDRPQTHHVSGIVIVDKKVNKDWPLKIQSHDGTWHEVYADVGDMILYESATCTHGRPTPFDGDYFRNFYVHFKLKRYNLV